MNRRDLLKLLPSVATAAVLPVPVEQKVKGCADNFGTHRAFFYYWCGWVVPSNQGVATGKWIASQPENPVGWKVYSAHPGAVEHYSGDQHFDLSRRMCQKELSPDSSAEEFNDCRERAFELLIRYIDLNYDLLIAPLSETYYSDNWKFITDMSEKI